MDIKKEHVSEIFMINTDFLSWLEMYSHAHHQIKSGTMIYGLLIGFLNNIAASARDVEKAVGTLKICEDFFSKKAQEIMDNKNGMRDKMEQYIATRDE